MKPALTIDNFDVKHSVFSGGEVQVRVMPTGPTPWSNVAVITAHVRSSDDLMAPHWVQTVKVADLISNTSSIVLHDPKFAHSTYLPEKRLLLDVLTLADPRLLALARAQIGAAS